MRRLGVLIALVLSLSICLLAADAPQPFRPGEELQTSVNEIGLYGGRLVVAQRSEPKTLNPVIATDAPSREVIGRLTADLIHINRGSQQTEVALARSFTKSRDGRVFTLKLRRGLRFSDGQPFDADDVLFSFQVYLDEKVHSPQRDLLIVGGKPMGVEKIDRYTVRFVLAQPYAAAERLFDSVAMLPRHLLEGPYKSAAFAQTWGLNVPSKSIAGLGPFRLKEYLPGQRIVLERNPYYWKADRNKNRLPYLDELVFIFAGNEDAQVLRFQSGDSDIISRVGSENYALLGKEQPGRGSQLVDLGPSLEYNFLVFNQNELNGNKLPAIARKQEWFRDLNFRLAVSAAVDRDAIVRLAYGRRGAALWGNVSPSNRFWLNPNLPRQARSLDHSRQLLKASGFTWRSDGKLVDKRGEAVEFSIITSSSSTQRTKMATIIQDDMSQLGMTVHVVPLEFRSVVDRVFQSFDYEASLMGLGGGDADPNSEMNVWLSTGSTHLWHLGQTKTAMAWEDQVDQLMHSQLVTMKYAERKKKYDEVQKIIAENVPFIFLATPNVLVGAKGNVGNFNPTVLDPYTLWNADELYIRRSGNSSARR
jgi:peptide/nickel transport system substrate-binding protein